MALTNSPVLHNQPGIVLPPCIIRPANNVPLLVINTTQRHFHLRKGKVLVAAEKVPDSEVNEVTLTGPPNPPVMQNEMVLTLI